MANRPSINSKSLPKWVYWVLQNPIAIELNPKLSVGSGIWYRIPFDQSEQSISKIKPTNPPEVRPGRDP